MISIPNDGCSGEPVQRRRPVESEPPARTLRAITRRLEEARSVLIGARRLAESSTSRMALVAFLGDAIAEKENELQGLEREATTAVRRLEELDR